MMLPLPSRGVIRSANKHNSDLQIVTDWLEASVSFLGQRVSRLDIGDVLIEDDIYTKQDFAYEFTDFIWTEIQRRSQLTGTSYPFDVDTDGLSMSKAWDVSLPYCFLLLLAIIPHLRDQLSALQTADFTQQGQLFEQLASHALGAHGWAVTTTGWSTAKSSGIVRVVREVADHLNEDARLKDVQAWFSDQGKDGGVDLVCSRPFNDHRGGRPAFLIQAASGANWRDKLHTPDIRMWSKVIDFSNDPGKGFCIPFSLNDHDFRRAAAKGGLFLDRYRLANLLSTHRDSSFQAWCKESVEWMTPFVDALKEA